MTPTMVGGTLAMIFCGATFAIAVRKNRNAYLWMFLGLMLGPFAHLAVPLLKTRPAVAP
jgi:uncharacterized membrane protein